MEFQSTAVRLIYYVKVLTPGRASRDLSLCGYPFSIKLQVTSDRKKRQTESAFTGCKWWQVKEPVEFDSLWIWRDMVGLLFQDQ